MYGSEPIAPNILAPKTFAASARTAKPPGRAAGARASQGHRHSTGQVLI